MTSIAPASDTSPPSPWLSLVVPAYNERESIAPLFARIAGVLEPRQGRPSEVIFIDDGSNDGTDEAIAELIPPPGCILKCIRMRRNLGKALALQVGFRDAEGDFVVTLDADLQDDPAEIPRLIAKLEEGWDVVCGWKADRRDPLEKRVASRLFNAVLSRVSGLPLHDNNTGLKAYRREVTQTISLYGEHHRFIPLIASSYGFRVTEIPVKHHERAFGRSKYGFSRYLAGALDLFTVLFVTMYRRRPLHFMARLGLIPFLPGALLVTYVTIIKFGFGESGNRPALTAGVFLLGLAFNVFLTGLLAELVTSNGFQSGNCELFVRSRRSVALPRTADRTEPGAREPDRSVG